MSYVRVSVLGATLGGEVWSVNPVFDPTGEFPGGVDQTALDAAATAIAALTPGSQNLIGMSTLMSITGARLEVREDSNDALLAISIATRGTALTGTGAPRTPPQTSAVFSLRTNTPGGSGRGRLYWPAVGNQITTAGRFQTGDTALQLTQMINYLQQMETALGAAFPTIGFNLAVRSRQTHTTPHVVRIQIGDVADTQRRRRDHLPESYQQAAI